MDEHLLAIYQAELRTQCQFIVMGANLVNQNLKAGNGQAVWFGLQGMLVAAANTSKMLWGSRSEPIVEARRSLRQSVGVDDSSPLSSRAVRNDFEHFDERLDEWFGTSSNHVYLGRNIGEPGQFLVGGQEPEDQFGRFDPSSGMVTFWTNAADMQAIVDEAQRILDDLRAIEERRRDDRWGDQSDAQTSA